MREFDRRLRALEVGYGPPKISYNFTALSDEELEAIEGFSSRCLSDPAALSVEEKAEFDRLIAKGIRLYLPG